MTPPVDPQTVPCPRCDAGINEPCIRPSGDQTKTHKPRTLEAERVAAAHAVRAADEVPETITGRVYQRVYLGCRRELEHKAAWTRLAAKQLEAMCVNMEAADSARDACVREPTVLGSQDQPVPNGLWAIAMRLDSQALAAARSLKLTPDTRGTSALADGAEPTVATAAAAAEDDPEDRDELEALDELARKRRSKTG